ncbi:hypothetical protein K9M50_02145 [Patescibacteria group bacterium]|nr:hypothetical protein [Patescibacteria group bacterium]
MLSHLLGSNARVKILKLFLLNGEEKYYIRQIARDLGLQVNSVRRELENLEKFGLLLAEPASYQIDDYLLNNNINSKSGEENRLEKAKLMEKKELKKETTKQEKKYYRLNKNFVLYNEIKALITKSQILAGKNFIKSLQKISQPKYLALTGIFVNQDFPIDIFIVGRVNRKKLEKTISDLQKEIGKEINYSIMDLKEFNYRQEITDIFVYDIMQCKKITLINDLSPENKYG